MKGKIVTALIVIVCFLLGYGLAWYQPQYRAKDCTMTIQDSRGGRVAKYLVKGVIGGCRAIKINPNNPNGSTISNENYY